MNHDTNQFSFSPSDFGDTASTAALEFDTRYMKPPAPLLLPESMVCYEYAQALADVVELETSSSLYAIVSGRFIFGDLIEALIIDKGYQVKKMTISTLSMSENNVDSLATLLDGGFVEELNLIVSVMFFANERHDLIPYLEQELGKKKPKKAIIPLLYEKCDKADRFQLAVCATHCKICIFETVCGKKVVIHGSANLRSSDNIEQICIQESAALYDFNDEFQGRIVEKYKTINKAVRGKELWEAVVVKNLQ